MTQHCGLSLRLMCHVMIACKRLIASELRLESPRQILCSCKKRGMAQHILRKDPPPLPGAGLLHLRPLAALPAQKLPACPPDSQKLAVTASPPLWAVLEKSNEFS